MRDARHIRPLANVKVVFHVPCKCVVVKPVDKLFEIICIHIGADEMQALDVQPRGQRVYLHTAIKLEKLDRC